MNQRSGGGQRQGNAPRQMQRRQQPERIDYEKQSVEVLGGLEHYRGQLEHVLPSGMTWERFHATIATLLHHNPSILRCTVPSIIRGCMKAAYDGLALDGREAALVPSNNTYGRGENAVERLEARYNPMVAGLRKQILQSGLVDSVMVNLVYEGEPYRVRRGSQTIVEHEEMPELRGPGRKLHAVYAVAELKNGRQIIETMSRLDVEAIRKLAQTSKVWDAHEGEMWRKTCLRRIRKQLPGIGDVRDAEMVILFPEISRQSNPVPAAGALPAPPRPTRGDFRAALEPPAQTVDEFNRFDRATGEIFDERDQGEPEQEQQRQDPPREQQKPKPKAAKKPDEPEQDQRTSEDKILEVNSGSSPAEPKIPQSDDAWDLWAEELRTGIPELKTKDALEAERARQRPVIAKAPERLRNAVNDAFTEQLAEIATGPSDGAGPSQGSLMPEGENR